MEEIKDNREINVLNFEKPQFFEEKEEVRPVYRINRATKVKRTLRDITAHVVIGSLAVAATLFVSEQLGGLLYAERGCYAIGSELIFASMVGGIFWYGLAGFYEEWKRRHDRKRSDRR